MAVAWELGEENGGGCDTQMLSLHAAAFSPGLNVLYLFC